MANPISSFFNSLRPAQPISVEKAAGQSFAYGFMPGSATTLREDVLGQPRDANYDLLYAIYRINTDVSGSIDRWVGVVIGNDWQISPIDPELEVNDELQKQIDDITTWLKNPNTAKKLKFDQLVSETIMHLGVSGDAYWEVIRDKNGRPLEISNVHPSTMSVVCDEHGVINGYIQRVNGKKVADFEAKEIIHFRLPSILNDLYGQSPLERAMEEITQDVKAMAANKSLLDNGFNPAAMLLLKDMSEQDAKKVVKQITQRHSGTSKWHKLMAFAGVEKVEPWGNTLKDMQFTELRELTTTKIATAYGVPKMYLNQKGAADFATSDVLERDLYNNIGKKLQRLLNELITEDLVHSFNNQLKFEFNAPNFADSDALRKDAITLYSADKTAIDVNELRELFGLPQLSEDQLKAIEDEKTSQPTEQVQPEQPDESTDQPEQNNADPAEKSVTKAIRNDNLDQLAADREAELDALADTLVSPIAAYFTAQERDYLERLTEDLNAAKLPGYVAANTAAQDTALHMLLFGLLVASLNAGSTAAQLQIDISLNFDQVNPMVQEYLQTDALQHAQGINATTQKLIKEQLSEGIRAGEGIDKLAFRVQSVFTDAKGYRSTLIARAETAQAYAHANEQSLAIAGAEFYRWLTAGENRVCPICAPLNGYVIRAGAQFPDDLRPSFAHIQCRCQLLAATQEDYDQFQSRNG